MCKRSLLSRGSWTIWVLLILSRPNSTLLAAGSDDLWTQFRGPSHGRAELASGPVPPFELRWTIDLWDKNDTGTPDDCILFGPQQPWELSPAGLGIAWRADANFLYAFEVGFYSSGKQFAVFDRRTGELLSKHSERSSQPLASKRVMSIHDDPGFGKPLVFFGNFYAGQRFYTVARAGKILPLGLAAANLQGCVVGHACEGPRWLQGRFYLNGGGAAIKDGASYRWGSDLRRWSSGDHEVVLQDISVPAAVWDRDQLILFARGGLTGTGPRAVFTWHDYLKVGVEDDRGVVRLRRRVTNMVDPTGDDLFEEAALAGADQRMLNRARNAVRALAISVDGRYVYCQERKTAQTQRIVRRDLQDFSVAGMIAPEQLPAVQEQSTFGHANLEMGLGIAVDANHFYLHSAQAVHALSLDLRRVVWSAKVPPRYINGHSPFSMNRAVPRNNAQYAARGTENTLAVSGDWLYLTTNTTLQVHSTATGEERWSYTFLDLPSYLKRVPDQFRKDRTTFLRAKGFPGDILLAGDAVYVATHSNQSHLYCFMPAAAVEE